MELINKKGKPEGLPLNTKAILKFKYLSLIPIMRLLPLKLHSK